MMTQHYFFEVIKQELNILSLFFSESSCTNLDLFFNYVSSEAILRIDIDLATIERKWEAKISEISDFSSEAVEVVPNN